LKPNHNLYRLKTILDFTGSQQKFLEQIGFFNPEPQIIDTLKFFPNIDRSGFTRLITWQAVDNKGALSKRLHDLQAYPFRMTLDQLSHRLNEKSFKKILRDPLTTLSGMANFKILELSWLIKLWEDHNSCVPVYAPKRLSNGLKFVYIEDRLVVSFQEVSLNLWLPVDVNPTKVIPLTHENFDQVIKWQTETAQKLLASHHRPQ